MPNVPDINLTGTAAAASASGVKKAISTADETKTSLINASATDENELQSASIEETDSLSLLAQQGELAQQTYQMQIEKCTREMANLKLELNNIEQERASLITQMASPDVEITDIMNQFTKLSGSKNKIFSQMQSLTSEISTLQIQMQQDLLSTQASMAQMQALSQQASSLNNTYASGAANIQNIDTNSEVGAVAAQMGQSFVGVINSDAQGNKEFTPGGRSQAWCADFATAITKRAYQAKGMAVPSGFGSSAVSGLKSWGESKGIYLDTASNGDRAQAIAQSVKPGDLMIQKRNGASHTGIVTKVYPDGSFDTVEGNTSDSVKNRHYSANDAKLSGFVLMNALKS